MAVSMNRSLTGAPRPVSPRPAAPAAAASSAAFARKSAAAKAAQGWGETIKDLPSEAVDKFQRTAVAIMHPIDTVEKQWAEIKARPSKVLVPLAMMAGGAALTVVSPGLMRVVGIGMTASMFVFPTIRFAGAKSEGELLAAADGTSKQLVDTATYYATSWAAGRVIRYGIQKLQARQAAQVGGASIQGRGDVQLKGDTPGEMKIARGEGAVDPDAINFRALRNDKELGHRFVTEVRTKVADFHFKAIADKNPGVTRAEFDAFLKTPEARPLRLQMVQDVRGVVHANYLGAHGVQVPNSMTIADMVGTRKYLQDFSSTYDLADAVRGINAGVAKGVSQAAPLAIEAERFLYAERGVTQPFFAKFEQAALTGPDLKKVRLFADRFATGQSGKYLKTAAQAAAGADVDALRGTITRQLMMDLGFVLPKGEVDNRVFVSLLRDLSSEDPRNIQAIIKTTNEAFRQGKTNYYELNEIANRKLLAGMGVTDEAMKALDVADDVLKAAKPDLPLPLARAEQVKLLRDRLRVLPDAQRAEAVQALQGAKATLLDFDKALAPHLDAQLGKLSGADAALVAEMTRDMTIQQKTNFVTDLARLPEGVRQQAFKGLTGPVADQNKAVVGRLATLIEQQFEVKVHREAGKYPMPYEWAREDDPFVKDWSVQGVSQLFNGLDRMAVNGKSPADLKGTLYVNMNGSAPSPGLVPFTTSRPTGKPIMYYKPGSDAYKGGTMGYRTALEGQRDMIVLFDDAMKMPNADERIGVSMAEGTLIHESGHAIQLGGRMGMGEAAAKAHEQRLVKEWSALSAWKEKDGSFADGYSTVAGAERRYYKDPSVQVGQRPLVVSDYGATDSVEDFAEFTRTFYNDPGTAMAISPEKFLYMNQMFGDRYAPTEVNALATALGIGPDGVTKALANLRKALAATAAPATKPAGFFSRLLGAA